MASGHSKGQMVYLSSLVVSIVSFVCCGVSVDFFNLYHNKIAGKVTSVGSIILSCLLLPPDMWYKSENLCLVGIIPGPHEPSGHEIDHFLRPLVEIMKESWEHGARYRTHDYPHGRLVHSA